MNYRVDEVLWDTTDIDSSPLVSDRLQEVTEKYLICLHKSINKEVFDDITSADCKFVYSAMHGVGFPYIEKSFEFLGFQVVFLFRFILNKLLCL